MPSVGPRLRCRGCYAATRLPSAGGLRRCGAPSPSPRLAPKVGLEPTPSCEDRILSPARLPGKTRGGFSSPLTVATVVEGKRQLRRGHYPDRQLRCRRHNLNTHSGSSLNETFPPEEARPLLDRLEIHPTPKHASCLDMAEIELRIMRASSPTGRPVPRGRGGPSGPPHEAR